MACVRLRKIMPIMLALCLMLLHIYYAKNYAGIIDSGLSDIASYICMLLSDL